MSATVEQLANLSLEFEREDIHWRAQSVRKDGSAAMALAYIDARNVMDRLDLVAGVANWQDDYTETASGRVICRLSIRVDGEWITKADGAGSSAIEGEKGGISDALKRAAVKWGIGRYLYDMPTPWVPCESQNWNNKMQWKRWTANPWDYVKGGKPVPEPAQPTPPKNDEARAVYSTLQKDMRRNKTKQEARRWWTDADVKELRKQIPADWDLTLKQELADMAANLADETAPGHISTIQAGE